MEVKVFHKTLVTNDIYVDIIDALGCFVASSDRRVGFTSVQGDGARIDDDCQSVASRAERFVVTCVLLFVLRRIGSNSSKPRVFLLIHVCVGRYVALTPTHARARTRCVFVGHFCAPKYSNADSDDESDGIALPVPVRAGPHATTSSTSSALASTTALAPTIDVDHLTDEQAESVRRQAEQNRLFVAAAEARRASQRLAFLRSVFPFLSDPELTLALTHCDDDDVRTRFARRSC